LALPVQLRDGALVDLVGPTADRQAELSTPTESLFGIVNQCHLASYRSACDHIASGHNLYDFGPFFPRTQTASPEVGRGDKFVV
jgi:hypothetical protein